MLFFSDLTHVIVTYKTEARLSFMFTTKIFSKDYFHELLMVISLYGMTINLGIKVSVTVYEETRIKNCHSC